MWNTSLDYHNPIINIIVIQILLKIQNQVKKDSRKPSEWLLLEGKFLRLMKWNFGKIDSTFPLTQYIIMRK